ncbi:MAG TPA: histidine ammonia-lyase [Patescibacteria group bacterium]|nr:histidine ammonia-lyase [Patescibacteria group bacterium]
MKLYLDGNSLTIQDFWNVVHTKNSQLALTDDAKAKVLKARALVDKWTAEGKVIYGITTGFGEFANVNIPPDQLEELQENLILSHSVGSGAWMPENIVRGMLLLRINALAKGHSGIRLETLEALIGMFNHGIIPAVPEQGSVGSSGDLVQLSHIALALIGKGKCIVDGALKNSAEVLKSVGIEPVRLKAKEGLALINGTQMMCSYGAHAIFKAYHLSRVADVAGAFTLDALRGTDRAYDARLHALRPYTGQQASAQLLKELLSGSEIRESHRIGDARVQDAYSLRCMPQVHGASRDTIDHVLKIITTEINSANDNPLIFPEEEDHLEGGNFHGQPLALALDFLTIACAEFANISERRTERMVNGALSSGLPRFLTKRGGVQSGMMIAQYTSASIVSENKVLSHPASVDSIPTSANQEDHNSMGSISAQKCWKVVNNLQTVLAIELLCAAQAIDFLRPLKSSPRLEAVHAAIRTRVPFAETDRVLFDDIQEIRELIESGEILKAANVS